MRHLLFVGAMVLSAIGLGAPAEAASCYPAISSDGYYASTLCVGTGGAPFRVKATQWGSPYYLRGPWSYGPRSRVFCPSGCNGATSEIWYG